MALSIQLWADYTAGSSKLASKSEAAVEAERVLKFLFDTELQVVNANVQASMRNCSYKVMLQFEDGKLTTTSCECPLQEYKCHHVAATLLYGYRNVSKTSVKNAWLKRPKSAKSGTMTISDIYPDDRKDYRALRSPFSEENRQALYDDLRRLGRFTSMLWILAPEPAPHKPLPTALVEDLIIQPEFYKANRNDWLKSSLSITAGDILKVAVMTKGQRNNPLWAGVRKLRFTASNFGPILAAERKGRITPSLLTLLFSPYNLEKVAAIHWGIIHEETAIEEYKSRGGDIMETGIFLHPSGVLAASPDGVVKQHVPRPNCDHPPAILEVKCPYSARDMMIHDAARSLKDFFLGFQNGGLYLKKEHKYYHQIQGQLDMTQQRTCDLVVWTRKDFQIVEIHRDMAWAENITKMIDFYFEHFIPSLDG